MSFFAEELPKDGWEEEKAPYNEVSDKEGAHSEWVIWSFVRNDLRLSIIVPLTHKDAPDGVSIVQLMLAPKSIPFNSAPVATPIDATPLPIKPIETPDTGSAPSPSGNSDAASPTANSDVSETDRSPKLTRLRAACRSGSAIRESGTALE